MAAIVENGGFERLGAASVSKAAFIGLGTTLKELFWIDTWSGKRLETIMVLFIQIICASWKVFVNLRKIKGFTF